jgi:hypothetical protein
MVDSAPISPEERCVTSPVASLPICNIRVGQERAAFADQLQSRHLKASQIFLDLPGVESPLHGIAAITKSVAGFMNAVTNFRVTTPMIRQIEGEDAIIADFTGGADVLLTGRQ